MKKTALIFLCSIFTMSLAYGQFYTLDFESAGGYTTSISEFTDLGSDYFLRTNGADIATSNVYNSPVGTFFFAGQDLDGEGATLPLYLDIDDIDISGQTNIELRVYLAEDEATDAFQDWDGPDYFHIGYDIDNSGTFTPLLWVESEVTGTNGVPRIDTDFDGVGDGTEITDTFVQFTAAIPGTGSLLDIQMEFDMDSGDEDIALDHVQLFTGGGPAPLVLSNYSRQWLVPSSSQSCDFNCDVTGGTPPYTVTLEYDLNGVTQTGLAMALVSGNTYGCTMPAQNDGDRIEYYYKAVDSAARAEVTGGADEFFWGNTAISAAKALDGNGVMLYDGYVCRLTGVCLIDNGIFSTSNMDTYIQDGTAGINVFAFGEASFTMTAGNSYSVVGTLDQFNGKAEIIPDDTGSDITDNGASTMPVHALVTMAELLADPETYEGSLIGIPYCVNTSARVWPTGGSFVNVPMSDDGGTTLMDLRINNVTAPMPEPTWPRDIIGICVQYDTSSPYDTGYQWMSRSPEDYYEEGALPIILSSFTAVLQQQQELIMITWITESEFNISHFNLYRDNQLLFSIDATNTTQTTVYEYEDGEIEEGETYSYLLEAIHMDLTSTYFGPVTCVVDYDEPEVPEVPTYTKLWGNYPNPFNPATVIKFQVKGDEAATLKIYNTKGQLIHKQKFQTGSYTYEWNAEKYGSGVYMYELESNTYSEIRKMVMTK